jgi:hypothetical protein
LALAPKAFLVIKTLASTDGYGTPLAVVFSEQEARDFITDRRAEDTFTKAVHDAWDAFETAWKHDHPQPITNAIPFAKVKPKSQRKSGQTDVDWQAVMAAYTAEAEAYREKREQVLTEWSETAADATERFLIDKFNLTMEQALALPGERYERPDYRYDPISVNG